MTFRSRRRLRGLCAALIGITLLFSGFVKAADPVGTEQLLKVYLQFFHLRFLLPAARGMGCLLAYVEGAVAIGLLCGVARRLVRMATLLLVGFFSLVTVVLWISHPAMECGCFGEAIHLTHAQSLLKNIVLVALSAFVFFPRRIWERNQRDGRKRRSRTRRVAAACIGLATLVGVALQGLLGLPPVDFTPFAPGVELFAAATAEEEEEGGNLTAGWGGNSAGWEGKTSPFPPVLSFCDEDGVYCDSLAVGRQVVIFSVYDVHAVDWNRLLASYHAVERAGGRALLLWGEGGAPSAQLPSLLQGIPAYRADYKTLLTLNRSNGGGTYVSRGEIVCKWASRAVPSAFEPIFDASPVDYASRALVHRLIVVQGLCLLLLCVLLFL